MIKWQGSEWPPEMERRLREMAEARYSGSKIARELGVSRSAVAGKAARMGVKLRALERHGPPRKARLRKPAKTPASVEPSPAAAGKPCGTMVMRETRSGQLVSAPPERAEALAREYAESPARRNAFDPATAPADARLVRLEELRSGDCKWPLYEDGPAIFCGAPVRSYDRHGQPAVYCNVHGRMAGWRGV